MAALLRFLIWRKVVMVPKQAPIVVSNDQAASLSSGCRPSSVHCQDHSLTMGLRRIETGGRTCSEEVTGPTVSSNPGRSYAAWVRENPDMSTLWRSLICGNAVVGISHHKARLHAVTHTTAGHRVCRALDILRKGDTSNGG